MSSISATNAKNRFGELLEMSRREPVHVQKNGRDVAVVVSPEQYAQLIADKSSPKVRPAIEELLQRSVVKRKSLYQALAR